MVNIWSYVHKVPGLNPVGVDIFFFIFLTRRRVSGNTWVFFNQAKIPRKSKRNSVQSVIANETFAEQGIEEILKIKINFLTRNGCFIMM